MYGEVVREALKAGYRLVPYEDRSGSQKVADRERHQAENLNNLLKRDPAARVLVYAGFNHVLEKPDPGGNLWMAGVLKQLSRTDQLTVDQTTTLEKGWGKLSQASVLRKPDGTFTTFGDYAGKVDLQVFHPVEQYQYGRPTWLVSLLGRKPFSIPNSLLGSGQRVLVQAFLPNESDDGLPFDQIVVDSKREAPRLMLKPGTYKLVVQNEIGKRMVSCDVEVR